MDGNNVYTNMDPMLDYNKALDTWSNWIATNINPRRSLIKFSTNSHKNEREILVIEMKYNVDHMYCYYNILLVYIKGYPSVQLECCIKLFIPSSHSMMRKCDTIRMRKCDK
jgi:hypothetical protein